MNLHLHLVVPCVKTDIYINNDTSLILYARRQQHPATGILPLRKIRDPFAGSENDNPIKVYNNEIEILSDSLYSTLKYPMVTGTEWSYTIAGYKTNKKYSGFENVSVPSGTISCMKVNVVYIYLPTATTYNFYSKFGLIKSDFIYNDIVFTNIINPDGAGTFDLTNENIVTSFNIPSN